MIWGRVDGLDKVAAVYDPPQRAVEAVASGEWRTVFTGWVLVIWSPVFVNDGVLRLDGVVKVG